MKRKKQQRKELATLRPNEIRDWEYYFSWYLNNGFTEMKAGRNAWRDLQEKYPRLKKHCGCKP